MKAKEGKITSFYIDENDVLHTYIKQLKHVTFENVKTEAEAEKLIREYERE